MEHFIETVKQFPILWNTEEKDYRDLQKKENAWRRIVEEINDPDIPDVQTAKSQWKKLRDNHRDSLKRMKTSTTGQGASSTNTWKYAESLEFLLPYMRTRKRTGHFSHINQNILPKTSTEDHSILRVDILEDNQHEETAQHQSDDSNLTSEQSISQPLRRRSRKVARAKEPEESKGNIHPLNLFFDSMCESTKKLPDWMQRDVKKKILNIVCEAEETYENYLNAHSAPPRFKEDNSFE